MKTLANTFLAVALIVVSTFTMAIAKPKVPNKKTVVNLSTATLAIDHYVAIMTAGESAGLEKLFTSDFTQKINAKEGRTNSRTRSLQYRLSSTSLLLCNCSILYLTLFSENSNYCGWFTLSYVNRLARLSMALINKILKGNY